MPGPRKQTSIAWEYDIQVIPLLTFQLMANDRGKDGWEIYHQEKTSVTTKNESGKDEQVAALRLYMKRRLS